MSGSAPVAAPSALRPWPLRFLLAVPWGDLLRNLAIFLVTVWLIASATFFLARAIPGGPFTQERFLPPTIQAALEARYRLDRPVWRQYLDFFATLFQRDEASPVGFRIDLGPSFYEEGRSVSSIIAADFPRSALLGAVALCFSLGVGVPLGVIAAMWRRRALDHVILTAVVAGVSVPSFILASLLQYLFAYRMEGFLPASGLEGPRSLVMPGLALSAFGLAFIIRLVRTEMIDVLRTEFILAARSRGVGTRALVWRHALRNALLPVVTYLGPLIAALFTGSFVIESIFDIPGLGRQYVNSIENRDYGLILGVTLFYSAMLVGLNMFIDFLYRWIDPRIESGRAGAA